MTVYPVGFIGVGQGSPSLHRLPFAGVPITVPIGVKVAPKRLNEPATCGTEPSEESAGIAAVAAVAEPHFAASQAMAFVSVRVYEVR
jgi:hypothetical protein